MQVDVTPLAYGVPWQVRGDAPELRLGHPKKLRSLFCVHYVSSTPCRVHQAGNLNDAVEAFSIHGGSAYP